VDFAEEPNNSRAGKVENAQARNTLRRFHYGSIATAREAFDHSLDKPETLVKLYAILGRIRLMSSDAVLTAAEECCDRVVDLYAKPNRTMPEIFTTLHSGEFEFLKHFSDACRIELHRYSAY
jgi:hypothetical protein